ncbi:hypothetical protein G6F56_009227 [Rhizopus delemar]|nr:hypothetical protein G6F56_009227 [Rhizopus delemar]
MTYGQVDRMSTHLACQWRSELTHETSVISFLGTNGTQYLLTVLALLKINKPLLLISPRNSDAANANLLETTGSKLCIITPDQAHKPLGIRTKVVEPFERWMHEPLDSDWTPVFDEQPNEAALIIHRQKKKKTTQPNIVIYQK